MSQHFFVSEYQNHQITVKIGWDRPLQCFYMDILIANEDPQEEPGYLYSHMQEARPFTMTLDDFRSCLTQLGINAPESIFQETEKDAKADIGNRFVTHQLNGELVEL